MSTIWLFMLTMIIVCVVGLFPNWVGLITRRVTALLWDGCVVVFSAKIRVRKSADANNWGCKYSIHKSKWVYKAMEIANEMLLITRTIVRGFRTFTRTAIILADWRIYTARAVSTGVIGILATRDFSTRYKLGVAISVLNVVLRSYWYLSYPW